MKADARTSEVDRAVGIDRDISPKHNHHAGDAINGKAVHGDVIGQYDVPGTVDIEDRARAAADGTENEVAPHACRHRQRDSVGDRQQRICQVQVAEAAGDIDRRVGIHIDAAGQIRQRHLVGGDGGVQVNVAGRRRNGQCVCIDLTAQRHAAAACRQGHEAQRRASHATQRNRSGTAGDRQPLRAGRRRIHDGVREIHSGIRHGNRNIIAQRHTTAADPIDRQGSRRDVSVQRDRRGTGVCRV